MEKNNISEINNNENIKKKKESTKNSKYKIKFSAIIEDLRQNCDKIEKVNNVEFNTNILLMSSQINITNKISCLTVLSYINYVRRNSLYTYYLNKKIFKYLQIQKSIESFIYIRTLYRAAFFLEKEKNYFYAKKLICEAYNLSKNSKIDNKSKGLLIDLNNQIDEGIGRENDIYIKKFKNVENPSDLTKEKYIKLLNLFNNINNNIFIKNRLKTNKNIDINEDEDIYFYLINKNWFNKAFKFLSDYHAQRQKSLSNDYILKAFNANYCYKNYFDMKEENKKENNTYNPFPGKIDNYSLINWTDNLYDPYNEDENFILKKNLVEGKDYILLEKNDFYFLENFFGITNIIKRKKNFGDFVEINALILEEKFFAEEYKFLLRKRHFQIGKNYKIKDLKQKILRCIDYNKNKEKYIKDNILFKENNKNKKEENKIDIEKDEKKVENDKDIIMNNLEDINDYEINFYLLEKNKKDILIEICISMTNNLNKYESIYLQNIPIVSEEDYVINILSQYNLNKHILIIDLHKRKSSQLITSIHQINNSYNCSICKKDINSLDKKYKCNICNYSIFCSEECANKDTTHLKLDEIFLTKYLYEQFELSSFLKIKINDLNIFEQGSRKGIIGLMNLGNTCYINSTMQCLSNTLDLTKYFLLEYFRNDINTGNKLGSNGNIAVNYYNLVKAMWYGVDIKINPSSFVDSIKKFKKQFAGYKQQDAQEFLSVLLDQLHEDLNRITEKPYIELLEKQNDENDLVASKRWWDLHKQREDSIIVDLFNGQFKSETICQVCNKSSITYDPFISLCVPLITPKKHLKCKIFCDNVCKYLDYEYNEDSTILDLKREAFEFLLQFKNDAKFDLETVILDLNKNIIEIISTNVKDENFKGQTKLKNLLINNEIVFFKKENYAKDKNIINIYIYPIEHQKPDKNYYYYNYQKDYQLKYITYPLFFQMRKEDSVQDLYNLVFNRIKNQNFFINDKFNNYMNNNWKNRILELNIVHGKNTKKDGFFSYFFWQDDKCKFCGQSNDDNYYCSILNLGARNNTLEENFSKLKTPIILVATSECYNLYGINTLYSDCPLFNTNNGHNLVDEFIFDNINLKDCLHSFVSNENYQDDDSWFCSNCKKLQKSRQKLQIYKPPIYLIILLKRYGVKKNYDNFYGEKNNTFVSYPTNNFDIREYIEGPEKNKAIYDLYGVIEHYGTLSQGHYTAICKNDDKWIYYNDSNVEVTNKPVSKKAYILFYKMQNYQ